MLPLAALLGSSFLVLTTDSLARVPSAAAPSLPIAKRVRWFVDVQNAFVAPQNQDFMFNTHKDIVDGVIHCCAGSMIVNGSFSFSTRPTYSPVFQRFTEQGKEVILALNGETFPHAAFLRRENFAQEVLAAVLKYNVSGVTLDYEGYGPLPTVEAMTDDAVAAALWKCSDWQVKTDNCRPATGPQFAATFSLVAELLHAHNKTLGVCISDGKVASDAFPGHPSSLSHFGYTGDLDYPRYIPFADFLTDMSTYNFNGVPSNNNTAVACPFEWQTAHSGSTEREGLWCHINGYVLDQLDNGVSASSGQLSPGLWAGACNENGTMDDLGWTHARLTDFLSFLDLQGVRSIDMWTSNGTLNSDKGPDSCPMPCPAAPTCPWFLDEIRAWRKRDPDGPQPTVAVAPLRHRVPTDSPIPKRVRWFVDVQNAFVAPQNQDFMFNTHKDIVDGVIHCCAGSMIVNGSFSFDVKQGYLPVFERFTEQGKEVILALNGLLFPHSAFLRRENFAQEVLAAVLKYNVSGVTLDYEGYGPLPTVGAMTNISEAIALWKCSDWQVKTDNCRPATAPQFAATFSLVAELLHAHNKTLGVCISDGKAEGKNSQNDVQLIGYTGDLQ